MLSFVVLFGLITAIFGTNTSVLPSSNQTVHSKTGFVNMSFPASINPTAQGNSESFLSVTASIWSSFATQSTSTQILSPSNAFSTRTDVEKVRATTETSPTVIKAPQALTEKPRTTKENETRNITILPANSKQTPEKTLPKTMSSNLATFSLRTSLGKQSKSVEVRTSTSEKPTKTVTEKNKEKVFWWNVTTGTLIYMFYGSVGVTLICIILLICVCCRWRRQTRTLKTLQRQETTLSNPYTNSERNNHVIGFPSPLQLDTFIIKPESPYDMPEQVGNPSEDIEISYVTVVDGNESDSQYAAVKGNGTANSIADSESRDDDSLQSPAYTNASVFENDPYQELMPHNRSNEDHYTSLINTNRDENKQENEQNEATV